VTVAVIRALMFRQSPNDKQIAVKAEVEEKS
jgi:hypothetical protein